MTHLGPWSDPIRDQWAAFYALPLWKRLFAPQPQAPQIVPDKAVCEWCRKPSPDTPCDKCARR